MSPNDEKKPMPREAEQLGRQPQGVEADTPGPGSERAWPSKPRGAKSDTAMCENRGKPGMIDKNEDC